MVGGCSGRFRAFATELDMDIVVFAVVRQAFSASEADDPGERSGVGRTAPTVDTVTGIIVY